MKQVVGIPEPLFKQIVLYLQGQPWKEANPLLAAVEKSAMLVDVNDPPAAPQVSDQVLSD